MPRRKKNSDQPIGVGLTVKQMKRKKPINSDLMRDIDPLTENQKLLFEALCHYDYHRDGTLTTDENASFHYLYEELRER